jgi:hypothetical protein
MRLMKAKSIEHEINILKCSSDYRTLEEVRKRESIVKANIEKSNKIKKEIEMLKRDPSFLQEETELSYQDILDQISNLQFKKL